MPLSNDLAGYLAIIKLGKRVQRATATLPQTGQSAIFNVVGGKCAVVLLGEVTTQIQAQANNCKLIANPTTGSDVDMCGVADITGLEVGATLAPVGTFSTALNKYNAGATPLQSIPSVVAIGTIDLYCSASSTGSVKWTCWYIPLEDGAYITAA